MTIVATPGLTPASSSPRDVHGPGIGGDHRPGVSSTPRLPTAPPPARRKNVPRGAYRSPARRGR